MNDELDMEAAEYVLGTLPADERARFSARLGSEAEAKAAVERWQRHFSPLAVAADTVSPPPAAWAGIRKRLDESGAAQTVGSGGSNVVALDRLRRSRAYWRGAALTATALAAALAFVAVIDRTAIEEPSAPAGGRYVAVVDQEGREPALIAEVDTTTGIIRIRSLRAEQPAGRSLELWHVAEGGQPRSLGLLQVNADGQRIVGEPSAGPVNGVIAVTVEPEGGSPSGAPTGPIVYTGRLIPID